MNKDKLYFWSFMKYSDPGNIDWFFTWTKVKIGSEFDRWIDVSRFGIGKNGIDW